MFQVLVVLVLYTVKKTIDGRREKRRMTINEDLVLGNESVLKLDSDDDFTPVTILKTNESNIF